MRTTRFIATLPRGGRLMLGVLALLLGASATFGQSHGIAVSAKIEDSPVVVGSPFTFTIEVSGTDDAQRPDLSAIASQFNVRDVGRSQSTSLDSINGRVVQSTTVDFHYQMVVSRTGDYTIPSVDVHAGGRTLRTNEVHFTAALAPHSDDFHVRIQVDNKTPYVGEPIQITLTMYTTNNFSMPQITDSGDFSKFDVTDVPNWNGDRQRPFTFLGNQVQPIVGRGTLDGRAYGTVTLACRLIPREAGHMTLGPVSVTTRFMITVRQGLFESSQPGRQVMARSDPIEIDVRPLPEEGRPAFFNGLIGTYTIHADATPKEVNVGDPITLHVMVQGQPVVDDVRLPDLESLPGFKGRLRVTENQADRSFVRGGAVFKLHVRALNDAVDAIPPIEIAYFDPAKGDYGVSKTAPIPLRVRPTRKVTAADAVGSAPASTGTTVETDRVGIAHNYVSPDALRPMPTSVLAEIKSPVWVTSMAAPPLAYAACAIGFAMKRRGEQNGAARRRSRALPEALATLRGAESVDAIVGGVGAYFEMVTGRPRASITPQDVEAVVAPVAPDEAMRLREILDRCDAARFAGTSVDDVRVLSEEAQGLLKAIEPRIRKGRA